MPDQDGVPVTAQDLVQGHRIGDQRADLVRAIRRDRGGRVAAHERCHRVETGLGQGGQQVLPGMGGVRKPVQAERQRARPGLEQPELKIVSSHRGRAHEKWKKMSA